MTVQRVTITIADEKFAPPEKEIDVSVIGGVVLITVYKGSLEDLTKGREKEYDVPEIQLHDLLAAISAHGTYVHGIGTWPKEETV